MCTYLRKGSLISLVVRYGSCCLVVTAVLNDDVPEKTLIVVGLGSWTLWVVFVPFVAHLNVRRKIFHIFAPVLTAMTVYHQVMLS